MKSKLIAVGACAFGYGALVAWAFTADHFDGKMKRNQLILNEMLSRKEARIVDLENRFLIRPPWNPITDEDVQIAAEKTRGDILSDESVLRTFDEGIEIAGRIDKVAEPAPDVEPVAEPSESEEVTRRTLQSLIDTYTADPNNAEAFVEKAGNSLKFAQQAPFHIPVDIYASDPDEGDSYAKITLTYYPRDRVLLDEDEDIIEVPEYVGWENLNRFGDESGDPDTVFVRNRRLLTDFEVIKVEDEDPPIHVRYGMSRAEFALNKAAGHMKFKDEDSD